MNKKKLLLWLIPVVVVIIVAVVLCLVLGKDHGDANVDASGEAGSYSVTVKTAGGMPMEGIAVYVYSDAQLKNMLSYGTTDAEGKTTLSLESGDHYISLSTVPKGYAVETYYTFNGNSADIVLTSSLITDEDLSSATLGVGDIMHDFSVTKPDGTEVKLSEVLKEKKVAVLNFWYTTCTYCVQEFPLMQSAHEVGQEAISKVKP